MKVAVLGSSEVGRALGRGFASRDREVMLGTRSPESERVQGWVGEGDRRSAGTFAEAAICGNDAEAKATVSAICEDFGWEAADLGSIERSRALEEMAMAWVYYGQVRGTWDHAFRMLHK